jgi:hypothetical protein
MRNSRRLVSGLALALLMSTGLSASSGLGGAGTDTCAWVAGMVFRVGAPEIVGKVLSAVFGC